MKMKISDILRKSNDETMAKIIGSVIAMQIDGISEEEAVEFEYPNTLEALQSEMDVDYTQTNADRIRAMNDEELAKERIDRIDMYTKSDLKEFIGDFAGIINSEEEAIKKELEWLQSEVE